MDVSDEWKLAYAGSYAHQTDHGKNDDYDADYFMGDIKLVHAPLGAVGLGFEHFGSDNGTARFVTPLATAHGYQGWADAYLDNGGPDGVQDLSVYIAPKLPMQWVGKLVCHHFWTAKGSSSEGDEIDLLLKRKFGQYVTATTKFAYFDGTSSTGPADRWRLWFQMELKL